MALVTFTTLDRVKAPSVCPECGAPVLPRASFVGWLCLECNYARAIDQLHRYRTWFDRSRRYSIWHR